MIIITPEAAAELRSLAESGGPDVLKFEAEESEGGELEASVSIVSGLPEGAAVEKVDGVTVAYCGLAESVFTGSTVALNAEGDLTLEMPESGCQCCDHGDGCGEDSCC